MQIALQSSFIRYVYDICTYSYNKNVTSNKQTLGRNDNGQKIGRSNSDFWKLSTSAFGTCIQKYVIARYVCLIVFMVIAQTHVQAVATVFSYA